MTQNLPKPGTKNFVPAGRPDDHGGHIFDYGAIPTDVARSMKADAEMILRSGRRMLRDMVNIGDLLLSNKERAKGLPKGTFTRWRDSLGISERLSQHFMRVASNAEVVAAINGKQPLQIADSAIYDLVAPSTPAQSVNVVLKMATDGAGSGPGGRVTRRDVKTVRTALRTRDDAQTGSVTRSEPATIDLVTAGDVETRRRAQQIERVIRQYEKMIGDLTGDLGSETNGLLGATDNVDAVLDAVYALFD